MLSNATVECWARTHVGRVRSNNEDTLDVSAPRSDEKLEAWSGSLAVDRGWALLADGMGGHVAGEVASYLAVELMKGAMDKIVTAEDVSLALNAVHAGLFEASRDNPALEGMGTTIAGILLCGSEAVIFNIGDSRIYVHSEGRLTKVSDDHVVHGHMLTQCLGGSFGPIQPHIVRTQMEKGSRYLLCSDGLSDLLSDEEINEVLSDDKPDPSFDLVERALRAGGTDNISVVVIGPF